VSSTQLTAAITASDIATAGTAQVTVFTPAPGGGTSAAVTFTINAQNPVPTLSSLSPSSRTAGGAGFTLTVNGSNFVSASVVHWNGANRTTTFVSGTQLTAAIASSDIATAGTAQVTVFTPTPGGGTSTALTFSINNAAPTLSSLSPSSATAGGAGFTLTVNGGSFVASSVVRWNGLNRTTTFVSSTQLQATILASDIASGGTASVTVFTSSPGGGTSNSSTFTVVLPPTITLDRTAAPLTGPVVSTMSNGTGGFEEWVGVFRAGDPGTNGAWVDWQWLTGGRGAHTTATGGAVTFPYNGQALAAGQYVIKWVSSSGALIGQSPEFTLD